MKTSNNISFNNSHFFVGVDTHLKNWKVTIRFNGIELKTFSMNPSPSELFNYLKKKLIRTTPLILVNYPGNLKTNLLTVFRSLISFMKNSAA